MAISIQCMKHEGYNGAKPPAEHCDSCWQIYGMNRLCSHFPALRTILPIKLVTEPYLGLATTAELLKEVQVRCEINGTLYYRTVDDPHKGKL